MITCQLAFLVMTCHRGVQLLSEICFTKRCDSRAFQGAWHVFVGKHFGAWVTYEACRVGLWFSAGNH